ncbi:lipid droplet-associated hydrolase-like isoform X2 [Salvia divinorum]|uniref:Lipid droplet-associated hydrolase-like isoform X2 n=1 Tax=Salvia divinorum TaxID=28513 RepID=A0ABD1GBC1_SALDI
MEHSHPLEDLQWHFLAMSPAPCTATSFIVALFGTLPSDITRFLVNISIGKSWSSSAVEALCTHVLKLPEKPDLEFIKSKRNQIALLFGLDYHWGPLHIYEELVRYGLLSMPRI